MTADTVGGTASSPISGGEEIRGQPSSECEKQCLALPRGGKPGDTTGNTLQCRMKYMAVAARSTLPEIHCAHNHLCRDADGTAGHHVLGLVSTEIAERVGGGEVRAELRV